MKETNHARKLAGYYNKMSKTRDVLKG